MKNEATAYVWGSGLIQFTTPVRRRTVPKGAIAIATGPAPRLKPIIEALARHGRGASKNKLLVPGIPEADLLKTDPLDALREFRDRVHGRLNSP